MNEFDSTGGGSGSWLTDVVGKLLDYKAKTSQPAVRWGPYGADGTQFGVLPDGSLIQRGTPAPNVVNSGLAQLSQLLPILLLVGLGVVAYRALR